MVNFSTAPTKRGGTVVSHSGMPWTFVLQYDNWDDFSYSTLFDVYYYDDKGSRIELGSVKIMQHGQPKGMHAPMPQEPFERLGDDYCSVGQDQSYYEAIRELPLRIQQEYLVAMGDCAFNLELLEKYGHEDVFSTSLLRTVRRSDISGLFHNVLLGIAMPTRFRFSFNVPPDADTGISVVVEPHSLPPTNVHVLIGRNGVGKTRLLSGIVDQLTGRESEEHSVKGQFQFPRARGEDERFTSVVSVAFSAFDQFRPVATSQLSGSVRYSYIGLKKSDHTDDNRSDLKSRDDLRSEFLASLTVCLQPSRLERWRRAIASLSSDPLFAEFELEKTDGSEEALAVAAGTFGYLSSGHKLVLLTITRLVEVVEEKTLVLIDEPETHLHPPLLASFTNAVSDLLENRNGVALVATHSPVVLQEVPASCVTIVDRSGETFSFNPPELETYGENVGTLTREVFNLEVLDSGFHKRIAKELLTTSYDGLIERFNGQIGAEGRALARVLMSKKRAD